MFGTTDISAMRKTALGRSFWLWFMTIALVVVSLAVCPAAAFAKDAEETPAEKTVHVESSDSGSSKADNPESTSSESSASEQASTPEPEPAPAPAPEPAAVEAPPASIESVVDLSPEPAAESPAASTDSSPEVAPDAAEPALESEVEEASTPDDAGGDIGQTPDAEPESEPEAASTNTSASESKKSEADESKENDASKSSVSGSKNKNTPTDDTWMDGDGISTSASVIAEEASSNENADEAGGMPSISNESANDEPDRTIIDSNTTDETVSGNGTDTDSASTTTHPSAVTESASIQNGTVVLEDTASSNDDYIEDKSLDASDIHNNSPNKENNTSIEIDIADHLALTVGDAELLAERLGNSDDNDASVDALDGSRIQEPNDSELEIASNDIITQAQNYKARIWFDVITESTSAGDTISAFGSGDDYIYYSTGGYVPLQSGTFTYKEVKNNALTGNEYTFASRYLEVTLDGSDAVYQTIKSFQRYSYTNTALIAIAQRDASGKVRETRYNILNTKTTYSALCKQTDRDGIIDIIPNWGSQNTWVLTYRPLQGFSNYTDDTIRNGIYYPSKSGLHVDDTVDLPESAFNEAMTGYNANTFAGWYVISNKELNAAGGNGVGTQVIITNSSSVKQEGAHKITSGETIWSIVKNAYGITPDDEYDYDKFFGQFDMFGGTNNGIVIAAATGSVDSTSYTVQYFNTDADGNSQGAVANAETHTDTSDTAKTLSDSGATTPTAAGYDVSFLGWAKSEERAKLGSSAGVDFKAGDAFNASDEDELKLFAVWQKTPQTFTVNYYPNATTGFGTAPSTVTRTPEVPATNNSSVSATNGVSVVAEDANTLWGARNGYTFLGWASSSSATAAAYTDGDRLRTINGADVTSSTVINLYAVWQDNNYTVNFNENGGTGSVSNPYRYAPNTTTLTGMPSLTRDGYTFAGWSEGGAQVANADGALTSAFISSATAGTTHTLTAIWNEIQYKINWYTRWNASGPITGYSWQSTVGSTSSSTVLSGLAEATAATPSTTEGSSNYYRQQVSGYTIQWQGWYLTKSTTGDWSAPATGMVALGNKTLAEALAALKSSNVTVTDTITIYGIWEKIGAATVTYTSNDAAFSGTGTNTTVWSDKPYAGDPYVIYGKQFIAGYAWNGCTFVSWNTVADGSGTTYNEGDSIASIISMTLYAQWKKNTVNFELNPGASDPSIDLHAKNASDLTAKTADVVKPSDLVITTPTRDNFEFKGWSKTEGGTVSSVILGPAETNTYTITATDASSDGATIKLYAVWEELTYTVSYDANPGTDTTNAVTFKHTTGTQQTETSPYTWAAKTKRSDSALDDVDIAASRNWYTFAGWAISASATASDLISHTATIGQLLTAAGETSRALKLYAVWTPITFTVKYEAKGTHGSVDPLTEVINLATGQASDVTGSTATANTAAGYQLATPTWTDVNGNAVNGSDQSAPQAFYKPTISYLRTLYNQVPSAAAYTFYANFEEQSLAYTVDAYLQQANGNYLSKGATNWGFAFTAVAGKALTAKLGTTIKATGDDATVVSTYTLAQLMTLSQSTNGVSNAYLYALDVAKTVADGKQELIIDVDTSKNVISLYYARTTYDLSAAFQTKDASGAVVKNDKPDGATDVNSVETYINGGSSTTALRWGQSISIGTPSTTGYTFAWSIETPSPANSTVPVTTFALTAADMKSIAEAASTGATPTASLMGTFTVKTIQITLDDTDSNSGHGWSNPSNPTVASSLNGGSYTYTKTNVAYNGNLSGWVPDSTDSSTTHYFAGWYDSDDPSTTPLSKAALEGLTNWTANKTYKALWLEKVVITYDVGTMDSSGASKAAWTTTSKHLSTHDANLAIASTEAKFATAVTNGEGDNGLPAGKPGWTFDYWTIEGSAFRIGHNATYPSSAGNEYIVDAKGRYLNSTDAATTGLALNTSYTFVAHWKADVQKFTVDTSGPVVNNYPDNQGAAAGTLPTGLPTEYVTDQQIQLSAYALTGITDGYELAGWNYVYTPSDKAAEEGVTSSSGTYGLNDDFHLLPGETVLTPRFNEKTVTFTYAVAADSNSRGSVNGTATDTVFVVTHNGVTTHTAQVTTSDGYEFVNWTLNGSEVQKDSAAVGATLTGDDLGLTGVLDSDRTYLANFKVKQYWVRFSSEGTDGTNSNIGAVTLDSSKPGYGGIVDYGYQVDYNTGIPAGSVSVTVPEGYELDGWIVNGAGGVQSPSGNAANLQGVYNFAPTSADITLTAHFKVSDSIQYTVKYVYDPERISGFSHTETSRVMAWGDEVYPENANAKNPTANGYIAKGWKITYSTDGTTATYGPDVSAVGNAKFGSIYTRLISDGASNVDTTAKTITIYYQWEAIPYTVAYDFYGNIADDPNTANDDVVWSAPNYDQPNTNVFWNDEASTFKRESITRVGYAIDHIYATVTTGSGVSQTSANVGNGDTYGTLATATDGTVYATVTLRVFWKSQTYDVFYNYDYTPAGSSSVLTKTTQHGWVEDVDFFTEGAAPSRDGWRFNGWEVHYTGNDVPNHLADRTGTTITATGTSTIRDLRNGDIALVDGNSNIGNPAVTLKALWVQEASYYFQDTLIWADGTLHDVTSSGGRTSATNVAGNSTIDFSSYGYEHGKTSYEGFDFDEHDAAAPAVPERTVYTRNSATATSGDTLEYRVYYLERTYTLNFYENDTDSTVKASTSGKANPYTSASPDLSTIATPTKSGWTFAGWYLTDGTNRVRIDGSDTKKISDLYATAPANGSTLRVVADWEPQQVQISWVAGANGSVNSSATSPDIRNANSANAAAAIAATPDSTDYVFQKWTYSYTDADGVVQSGEVSESSEFATLAKSSSDLDAFDILTPKQWNDGLWHSIEFTANFITSSALKVRIEYYLENGDNPGTYDFKEYETRADASDGVVYTVASPKAFNGYTLNTGMPDTHVYVLSDEDTHTYKVYYNADTHEVSYRYVVSDAEGAATQTDIPSGVGLPTTPYAGTFRTGQTVAVAPAPTAEGWTFAGWYKNRATGSVESGTVVMPADDLQFVGTWSRVYRMVRFINDSESDAAADGTTVTMNSTGGSVAGYSVAHGAMVKTSADAQTADATTLAAFGVTANNNTKPWKLSGWKVMDTASGSWLLPNVISSTQALEYTPTQNVTFVAQWVETHAVTYDPGMHGAFGTKSYSRIDISNPANTELDVNGASDAKHSFYGNDDNGVPVFGADGKPKAVDGYEFAGWGINNGTWTYYFAYDENIDYGMVVSEYTEVLPLPTTISGNIDFVAFFKRLERTVLFMETEYDGTTNGAAYNPGATITGTTTQGVRTGQYATMLDTNEIAREGYKLDHWTTDGTDSYTPGSSNEFQMGEYPDGTIVRLYPVFAYDTIEMNYIVATGQETWGSVDRAKDIKTSSASVVVGSKATAAAGYEFVKWTIQGSDAKLGNDDGVQSDEVTLKPSNAGTYVAVFKQREYTFSADNGDYADAVGVAAPTRTDGTSDPIHWTDSMTLGSPTLAGYTFAGWDVYESVDYSTNGTSGDKLHTGLSGEALVSALSSSDGTATALTLVPTFTALTYQVAFETGDADGDQKVDGVMPNPYSGAYDGRVDFAAPTRTGYTFKHWTVAVTTTSDGSTLTPAMSDTSGLSNAFADYKDLAGDEKITKLTLTAVWEALPHTLTYVKTGEFEGANIEGNWSSTGTDYPTANDPAHDDTNPDVKAADGITLGTDAVITLRGASALTKDGYKLLGWNDGTRDYLFGTDGTVSFTMPNGDATLTPIWDQPGEYSVVFENGTADGTAVADADITNKPSDRANLRYSADDIMTGKPALKGYEFLGWDSNNDGTADVTDYTTAKAYASLAGSDSVKTVTLTALWQKRNDYVVTFEPGTEGSVSGLPYGSEATPNTKDGLSWDSPVTTIDGSPATAPTRAGWAFDGWKVYTDAAHMHQVYTVAKAGESFPETVTFSTLANNTDAESLHLYLVAQWSEVGSYSVTFNPNAGSDDVSRIPDPQSNLTWGASVKTRHDDGVPVRAGYDFASWTVKDADGNELRTNYNDANDTYDSLANGIDVAQIVLWAQWTPKTYSVQFDANAGGDATLDASKIPTSPQSGLTWGATVTTLVGTADADKPTRAGYTFAGWSVYASNNTDLIGDAARVTNDSYAFSDLAMTDVEGHESLWLRAVWNPVLNTLTYHLTKGNWSDGTTGDATEQHGSGTDVTPRPKTSVVLDGYKLVGWQNADSDGGAAADKSYYVDGVYAAEHGFTVTDSFEMPVADYDLWPIWDIMTFTAHFADGVVSGVAVDDATMPTDPQTVAYDGVVYHAAPTRTGYTFNGWDVYKTSDVVDGKAVEGAVALSDVDKDKPSSKYEDLALSAQIDEITLIAKWEANKVWLSYRLTDGRDSWNKDNVKDGGPVTLNASISYEVDTEVTLRPENTVHRDGWVLVGWENSTNRADENYRAYEFDETTGEAKLTMPAHNVDLFPMWQLRSYKVTFDGNAPTGAGVVEGAELGNMPRSPQPADGDTLAWTGDKSVVSMGTPTFPGYEFRGWTVYDMDGEIVGNTGAEADGGTPRMDEQSNYNVLAGNNDIPARRELKLVANWRPYTYTVIFDDNVNANTTPITNALPGNYEGTYSGTVTYYDLVRTGYEFLGWVVTDITDVADVKSLTTILPGNTSSVFSDLAASNSALTDPNEKRFNLKFTAMWDQKRGYYVTFIGKDDDGATAADISGFTNYSDILWDDNVSVYSSIAADNGMPTRAGYTFGAERTMGGEKKQAGWVIRDITNSEDPAIIGYVTVDNIGDFRYAELAMNTSTHVADDTITHITLTALWTPNEHTVTYVIAENQGTWNRDKIDDAGKSMPNSPITYKVDETVELRAADALALAGYELTAWDATYLDAENATAKTGRFYLNADAAAAAGAAVTNSFTMEDYNVELKPVWTAKVYTVKFEEGDFTVYDETRQVVQNMPTPNPQGNLNWGSDVVTTNPTLAGYEFLGWAIKDAAATGARAGTFTGTPDAPYKYGDLAVTDTDAHRELTLVAQWKPAAYRVTYVDPFDANGAAAATPAVITTNTTVLWTDAVSDADPWNVYGANYADKSADAWSFAGWQVLSGTISAYEPIANAADLAYRTLAGIQGMTVADVASTSDTPALVLYASWTRRVPYVIDFIKLPVAAGKTADAGTEVVESFITLSGLDGDDVAATLLADALNRGDAHAIVGYVFDRAASAADTRNTGKLATDQLENPKHLVLLYTQLLDYSIVYDATPGKNAAGETTATAGNLAWDTPAENFVPVDSDWAYTGHKIVAWKYGPTGSELTFATEGLTFGNIATAIYGTVDGSEGRSADKPVELHAVWAERTDYKVAYNDNYDPTFDNGVADKFLGRVAGATYTPDQKDDVAWSASDILPSVDADKLVAPGVKDGIALYELDGWNYSATNDGKNQKPAEGMTFDQIAKEIFGEGEPEGGQIMLYARWKEVQMQLKYLPVLVELNASGEYVEAAGKTGATVSRASETVDAVSGTVQGASVTVDRGYHFVGWRRVSDGQVVYVSAWDPANLSTQAAADGNVMPGSIAGAGTVFLVSQNADDGYWHEETYQALVAQNDTAVLHYDKNAEDATGTINDVEEPYGVLVDLSDGSAYDRTYWTLVSWNTQADGEGTSYDLGLKDFEMPEDGLTLYAQWKRNNATFTYSPNGSGVSNLPKGTTTEWGSDLTVSDDEPKRAHYTFLGWNTKPDGSGDTYDPGDEFELPGDGLTLYAQWKLNSFDVTATSGGYTGGKVTTAGDDTTEIEYGGHVPKGYYTATPEDGYRLAGWSYTMIDEDGNVITGTVSDPSKLKVIGQVTFEPIFKEKAKKDNGGKKDDNNKGNNNKKPRRNGKNTRNAKSGSAYGSPAYGAAGGYLAKTGDNLLFAVAALAALAAAAAALLLVAARRRERR